MAIRVSVLGGGSWGTTVAHLAAHHSPAVLWCRSPDLAARVDATHENARYLPGFALHPGLRATADLAGAAACADAVVVAVPSRAFRATLAQAAPHLRGGVPVVSVAKGLERGTRLRMSQVVEQVVPGHLAGAMTGPNLSREIIEGDPAVSVVAMADADVAATLQRSLSTPEFRVYTNDDVVGCELGGALKNVYAIAAGMVDGLGLGDNTKAAVITRGLAELTRLGTAMGGRPATFAGLTGLGDLVATCSSRYSRNRHVGEELGRGRPLAGILAAMDQVAEGVETAGVVVELARRNDVDAPLANEVHAVLSGRTSPAEAYRSLLDRPLAAEQP